MTPLVTDGSSMLDLGVDATMAFCPGICALHIVVTEVGGECCTERRVPRLVEG